MSDDLPVCPRCQSVLVGDSQDCPSCTENEMRAGIEEAKQALEATRQEVQVDAYGELEAALRTCSATRRLVDTLAVMVKKVMDKNDLAAAVKSLPQLVRATSALGICVSKVSREALAFQQARSKLAGQMTPEEQIAQIIHWFERLVSERQHILLQEMARVYNERRRRSRNRQPWLKEVGDG